MGGSAVASRSQVSLRWGGVDIVGALVSWVKNFLILILALAFLEILLPSSGLRQFVKWLMGLVVLVFVLQPVVNLEGKMYLPEWERWIGGTASSRSLYSSLAMGQQIAEGGKEPMLDLMHKEQSRHIKSMLLILDGVEDAEVVTQHGSDGLPQRVVVTVKADSDSEERHRVGVGIEPVQVGSIALEQGRAELGVAVASAQRRVHADETSLSRKVRRFVASFYQLPEDSVTVTIQN